MNQQQKDLLIGTLLGDGHLRSYTKGRTWLYYAIHKKAHQEYLFHKYEILKSFCKNAPTQKTYKRCYFNTITHNCFKHYGNLFYIYDTETNSKIVPKKIKLFLTPRAIAYWYMDNGALKWYGRSNAMRICTEGFCEHGVFRLKSALSDVYNIETQLIRKNNQGVGYRLAINEKNSASFCELIKPYLVDCMRYRVSDGHHL